MTTTITITETPTESTPLQRARARLAKIEAYLARIMLDIAHPPRDRVYKTRGKWAVRCVGEPRDMPRLYATRTDGIAIAMRNQIAAEAWCLTELAKIKEAITALETKEKNNAVQG